MKQFSIRQISRLILDYKIKKNYFLKYYIMLKNSHKMKR